MEGESQSSYAQNMKSVFPINMVLYVVSEPMILGFRSKKRIQMVLGDLTSSQLYFV